MTTPATSLTIEAKAAYAAEQAVDATAAEDDRKILRAAATTALRSVLVKPDGTRLTLSELSLTVKDSDLQDGRVVWGDGTQNLAAILREEEWEVFVVASVDGQWTRLDDAPVESLSDIGAVLMKAV